MMNQIEEIEMKKSKRTITQLRDDLEKAQREIIDLRMGRQKILEDAESTKTVAADTIKQLRDGLKKRGKGVTLITQQVTRENENLTLECLGLRERAEEAEGSYLKTLHAYNAIKEELSDKTVECDALSKRNDELIGLELDARVRRDEFKNTLEDSRVRLADMKQNLHIAEMKVAKMEGYLDRVKEDDNARDGFEVVTAASEVIVPKRKPAATSNAGGIEAQSFRKKHWTDY